jgi:RNA polymerase sigma factor (TIGR02999 family)
MRLWRPTSSCFADLLRRLTYMDTVRGPNPTSGFSFLASTFSIAAADNLGCSFLVGPGPAAEQHAVAQIEGTRYLGYRQISTGCQRRSMTHLTELLGRIQAGEAGARDALFTAAYPELHRLARARLRDGGRNTVLDTTCLVHESYLRFVHAGELRAEDRRAFFAYASQVMRSVIVNSVRERIAQKRGGEWRPLTLSTKLAANIAEGEDTVLRVHEALEDLEKADPRLAQVAQMRYFGGYSEQEIAETLDVTERTVQRDWEKARLILAVALR